MSKAFNYVFAVSILEKINETIQLFVKCDVILPPKVVKFLAVDLSDAVFRLRKTRFTPLIN